ncbi:hypothetical protein COO60DRAFT_1180017 [Scenedesmus sp. NREL 46B-D3]|nr:hypothetical protein COO60DRAFT_1180017 [Scenedesmus sp. NREL 46B-D3]
MHFFLATVAVSCHLLHVQRALKQLLQHRSTSMCCGVWLTALAVPAHRLRERCSSVHHSAPCRQRTHLQRTHVDCHQDDMI